MNLDESDTPEEKKLTRKEKKALKRAEKVAAKAEKVQAQPLSTDAPETEAPVSGEPAEEVEFIEAGELPPPQYTTWEKLSPPAKRKKQLATMESGYREVLALVHSMRENQEVLMDSFRKLPEAVDSVKKLADHSAQQSDLLTAMNEQLESGSAGKFNETLSSMDKTTQLLLERAQRSEERLYSMLRRAQRRIAFMTLLVLLLFLGAGAAILMIVFPDQTQNWLEANGFAESAPPIVPEEIAPAAVVTPVKESPEPITPEPPEELLEVVEPVVEVLDATEPEELPMSEPAEATAEPEAPEEVLPEVPLVKDIMSMTPIEAEEPEELIEEVPEEQEVLPEVEEPAPEPIEEPDVMELEPPAESIEEVMEETTEPLAEVLEEVEE